MCVCGSGGIFVVSRPKLLLFGVGAVVVAGVIGVVVLSGSSETSSLPAAPPTSSADASSGPSDSTASADATASARPTVTKTASPAQSPTEASTTTATTEPVGGTVDDVVESAAPGPTVEAEDEEAEIDGDVTVRLREASVRDVEAIGPGETAGAAVVVDLEIVNGGDAPVAVDSAVVVLTDADGNVATPGTAEPYVPFAGSVEPGGSASATYIFRIAAGLEDEPFELLVTYAAGAPSVLISGTA